MNIIEKLKDEVKCNKKKIVLPETMDERVLKAAEIILKEGITDLILIGEKEEIIKNHPILSQAEWINPENSELTEKYEEKLVILRQKQNLTKAEAKKMLLEDYMYYACMLVIDNKADGIVSGACHSTANTLRPALQIIKTAPNSKLVSSFFLMIIPNCEYGEKGTFIFSDCGLNQNPTAEELASIAYSSSQSFKLLVGLEPYVAMLSHSTKGSAKHSDIDKVVNATNIAKKLYPQVKIDGELQLDAAIVPEIAKSKAPDSEVAGKANVLIFPDLDSGNIGYKLVQRLAKAEAYGPLTQGMNHPVNDLSRGCSVEDIIGVVIITAIQAQKQSTN